MLTKEQARVKRHGRIRRKMTGTPERPRLSVHRSLKNLYVQVIDDTSSKTLLACSTRDKDFLEARPAAGKKNAAEKLGELFGAKMKKEGIQKIAFDRGGYKYHGRIKALADSLRKAGIEF